MRSLAKPQLWRGIAVGLLTCLLAWFAGQHAALAYWRGLDAPVVPAAFANDPLLLVNASDNRVISAQRRFPGDAPHQRQIARAAIAIAPFNPVAMRQLGSISELLPPAADAAIYLDAAERMTRRDLPTQVALINQSIVRGDVGAILTHYDRALRVYPKASEQLYPSLIRAAADQRVQGELIRFAASPWFTNFLGQTISVSDAPQDLTGFVWQAWPHLPEDARGKLGLLLLGRLLDKHGFAEARSWINRTLGKQASALDKLGFVPATTSSALGGLSWTFARRDGTEVALNPPDTLEIVIDAGRGEPIAARTTILPPGSYAIEQTIAHEPGKPLAQLNWELHCIGQANPIWHTQLAARELSKSYRDQLTIPTGCQAQQWTLSALSSSTQFTSSVWVSALTLNRQD